MEFHVSREARRRYGIDESLFALSGNVILPDFRATRQLAARMNEKRDATSNPERAVQAGSLNAMGLIDEILHEVVRLYREQRDPRAVGDALAALEASLGSEATGRLLRTFTDRFPPGAVQQGGQSVDAWLEQATEGRPNREIALEELLLLWLANANPAFGPFRDLFDDAELASGTAYERAIAELGRFFAGRPTFGPENLDLVTLLRRPAVMAPESLAAQLGYLREHWGLMLRAFLDRLVVTLDVLREDERAMFLRFAGTTGGPGRGGPGLGGAGAGIDVEYERFSEDRDWMPRVVLLAKSTYVWLDQLSRTYGRRIQRLDEIPEEELDTFARWGITGLWLIGLWERSRASQRIKLLRGNPDAVASAYSLRDYAIAEDLGGPGAYEHLRGRAAARGIRLASDMVPNHMGIDSSWMMEHPDWFLSLADSPYPSYSFGGPDLSDDPRVGIFIEDHYFDSTDAAVVFRRLDRWTGEDRFVYHGNDGTSMPWNDTAQLNYASAEVREAVIQTILHVARQFPIIRFDAAMTLARRHVERLWFPEPGSGGAIPSRAEHGSLTREQFDAAMPREFWREVVDRVAAEVPDTLLLAEAFWLMEGYFVRTLGMHRVYNSAFMHMLRDEDNAGYRKVMKDTLEFDPEILKRYVNFMSNPDEATAIEQFGTGDKYFGVATLLVTMPGLPMVGHGQVEGFGEKYGMEYRRAYRDERPNLGLVAEHERRIFPLVHRRRIFAEVRDFLLYDFVTAGGFVDENVLAYSNRADGDRALVVYHNRFGTTRGRIRQSVPFAEKDGDGKRLVRRTLADGLAVPPDADERVFLVARDAVGGLEYLRDAPTLREGGWEVELDAYRTLVLMDWREMHETAGGDLARLAYRIGLGGVASVEEALRDLRLEPLHGAVRRFVNAGVVRWLVDVAARSREGVGPDGMPRRDGGSGREGAVAGEAPGHGEAPVAGEARPGGEESPGGQDQAAKAQADAGEPGAGQPARESTPMPSEPTAPVEPSLEPVEPRPGAAGARQAIGGSTPGERDTEALLADVETQVRSMLEAVAAATDRSLEPETAMSLAATVAERIGIALAAVGAPPARIGDAARPDVPVALRDALRPLPSTWGPLIAWLALEAVGRILSPADVDRRSRTWFDEAGFARLLHGMFRDLGLDDGGAWYAVDTVRLLLASPGADAVGAPAGERAARVVYAWFQDDEMARHLAVNRYEGVTWFNREAFDQALGWLLVAVALTRRADLEAASQLVRSLRVAADAAAYQVGRLLELVRD